MKKYSYYLLLIVFISNSLALRAQDGFKFFEEGKRYEDISFQLINNLVVIPIEINGKGLNFIFDTGVNKTIVFNASKTDTVFYRTKTIHKLRGLGEGEPVDAIISQNNRFRIKNLISHNQSVYIVLKDDFDLSAKMGTTIHGVIGYDVLKNLVVKIDYRRKKMRLFDPKFFRFKDCSKCQTFPLTIYQNKPYIDVEVVMNDSISNIPVKMLIDSGGSDAMWLFEHTRKEIVTPEKYFDDFLGVGLSGTIYGKRSRIKGLNIGQFQLKEPTVSFLDSIATKNARRFEERNGSIGSNILKRFKVWIDYPNKRMMLQKQSSLKGGFDYNMSGIEVIHNGKILVQEKTTRFGQSYGRDGNSTHSAGNSVSLVTSYEYKFKPSFIVNDVVKGSPADISGVKKGDVLLKINGKHVHDFKLSEIIGKFMKKPNHRIKLLIDRDGVQMEIEFRLKKIV